MKPYLFFTEGLIRPDQVYHVSAGDINPSTGKAYAINPSSGNWDDNYFSQNFGGNYASAHGGQQYGESPTAFMARQQQDLANKQATARDAQFAQDKTDIGNFNTSFSNATNTYTGQTYDKYHIPDQVSAVNALDGAIKGLSLNADNSGAGGYAGADQVQRAIDTNLNPNLGIAEDALGRSATAAQGELSNYLQPYLTQADLLKTRISTEVPALTQSQQSEMNGLIGAMQAGVTLTDSQLNYLSNLSNQENQLAITKLQQQYQPIGYGGQLYDTATGKTVGGMSGGFFSTPPGGTSGSGHTSTAPSGGGTSGSAGNLSLSELSAFSGWNNALGSFQGSLNSTSPTSGSSATLNFKP